MVRIATWNVEHGARPDRLARALAGHVALRDCDVLLIQEIEHHRGEAEDRTERLARALGLASAYVPARSIGRGSHGLAILARAAPAEVARIGLPCVGKGPFVCDRCAVAGTIPIAGRALRVVNVHLDTRLDTAERAAQVAPAFEAAQNATAAVIGGDFNTAPFRYLRNNLPIGRVDQPAALDRAAAAHGLANATAHLGHTTRRRRVFPWRLDAIYTRGLAIVGSGIAHEIRISDHLPLWIDVRWPSTEGAPVP
jgi:endonuclease/exonuclease/phosphatase family metal-dependent hydrolase